MNRFINALAVAGLMTASTLVLAQPGTHCVRSGSRGHISINCHGTLSPRQAGRIAHGLFRMNRRIFQGVWRANHNIMKHASHGCWLGIGGRWHCPH